MRKWTFRSLTPEDLPWLQRCRDASAHPFTALSAASLVTWAETYGMTVAGDDDFFVVRSRHDKGYYAPVGNPEKCAAFMEETALEEKSPHFLYMTEPAARELAAQGWNMLLRMDLSEYILSTAALSLMPGAFITHSFRDKCRKFARDYDGYRTAPVTKENLDCLREISEKFLACQTSMPSDQAVLETELDHFYNLDFRGLILTVPDGRKAFIMGYENTPEMFTMTMSRHDPTLPPEITAICIHEFASCLFQQYHVIDFEEDLGLDGLRKAKQLLSPVNLLKVYEVFL